MKNLKPFKNIGPGDVIKDEMEYYGWSQKDLAEILDISEKHLSQLLNNSAPISVNMARLLSSVFKQSPEFWINLDTNFRARHNEGREFSEASLRAHIYERMPIRDMQKKGWLPKKKELLVDAVKSFWNISEPDLVFMDRLLEVAKFKKSEALSIKFNAYFAQTWIQKVKLIAEKMANTPDYSKEELANLAKDIPHYSQLKNGIEDFINNLKNYGVIFILLPHLEKTFTDGAAYWVNNNPVIAITGRFKRNDNFWFTMAHEIGHVLLHEDKLKEPIFIDSFDNEDLVERNEENQANDFAYDVLKYEKIRDCFKDMERISRLRVLECSNSLSIHPGIVVGYLQYNKMLSFRNLNDLKEDTNKVLQKLQIP